MTVHLLQDTGPDVWDVAVAFGSAIIGAAAGAVPAYLLARRSSREVLARDHQARTERERSIGLQAHVKLGVILNSTLTLKRTLDRAVQNPPIPDAELWQSVEPVVGFGDEDKVSFSAEELALFIAAGKGDFGEQLLLLSRRHAVHAVVMDQYKQLREKLRDAMPPPETVRGTVGSTVLTGEQLLRVRPQMVQMNALLEQLIEHVGEDAQTGIRLAESFGDILQTYFKDTSYPGFLINGEARAIAGMDNAPNKAAESSATSTH